FPTELGQSVPKAASLSVPPTWIEDAPAFRMRVMWPPTSNPWNGTGTPLYAVQNFLRAGNSWPNEIRVHQPNWATVEEYKKDRPRRPVRQRLEDRGEVHRRPGGRSEEAVARAVRDLSSVPKLHRRSGRGHVSR